MKNNLNSRIRVLVGLGALIVVASAGVAAETDGRPADVQPGPDVRAATVGQLDWMAGGWRRDTETGQMEEHWLAPRGGMMLGLHRDVFSSGKTSFEYLRIEDGPEGPVYLASPGGRPATPFQLVEIGEQRAVFANPDHDFPQRILYWREGDHLHARIEGDTPTGNAHLEWTFVSKARYRKDASGK